MSGKDIQYLPDNTKYEGDFLDKMPIVKVKKYFMVNLKIPVYNY